MKRIHERDINRPDYYEERWRKERRRHYDAVRQRAFITGYVRPGDRIVDLGAGMYGFAEYHLERRMRSLPLLARSSSPSR